MLDVDISETLKAFRGVWKNNWKSQKEDRWTIVCHFYVSKINQKLKERDHR